MHGEWVLQSYPSSYSDNPHIVLIKGEIKKDDRVNLRIHSECLTGDVFGSLFCDCGSQLDKSLEYIQNKGGVFILVSGHEGRGIGIIEKIKAYNLQQNEKLSTYEANTKLGHREDSRDYGDIINILKYLNIEKIHLLTDNPDKIKSISEWFDITSNPIIGELCEHNSKYLKDKKSYFDSKKEGKKFQKKILNSVKDFPKQNEISDLRICIISTYWHENLVNKLKQETISHLREMGVKNIDEFSVPGCFEIPWMASTITNNMYNVIICFGVLIKGETDHFNQVSQSVTQGLMNIQLSKGIPIVDCVLSCYNSEQAIDRCENDSGLPKSYAITAIKMGNHHKKLNNYIN